MGLQVVVNSFPNGVDYTQRNTIISGLIALTAQTYTPGGIAINWLTARSVSSTGDKFVIESNSATPSKVWLASAGTTGYEDLRNLDVKYVADLSECGNAMNRPLN